MKPTKQQLKDVVDGLTALQWIRILLAMPFIFVAVMIGGFGLAMRFELFYLELWGDDDD